MKRTPQNPTRFAHTPEATTHARQLRKDVSRTERKLWPRLRSGQLGAPFRRQHNVGRRFIDYACVPLKLAIEVDGPLHSADVDTLRDMELQAAGYDVLHFSWQQVEEDIDSVVETIWSEVRIRLMAIEVSKQTTD